MRGLADPDSKIYSLLTKAALLIELNFLVLLCCLPVVTVGAAFSSMHAVLLKIYRGEEKHVASDFFRAMKENLKNGTALWLMYLGFLGILAGIWYAAASVDPEGSVYVLFGVLLAAVLGLVYLDWALIMQSRYVYTTAQCLKNALLAWLQYPGSTLVYLISFGLFVPMCLYIQLMPLTLLVGVTYPHVISTMLYSTVFDRMEGIDPRLPEL